MLLIPTPTPVHPGRQVFGAWSDPQLASEFDARMAELGVRWCCRPDAVAQKYNGEVGHQLSVGPAGRGGKAGGGAAAALR